MQCFPNSEDENSRQTVIRISLQLNDHGANFHMYYYQISLMHCDLLQQYLELCIVFVIDDK